MSARPPGPSIIAAETSLETMIAYWGEVLACIMKASLKRWCSRDLRPSRTLMSEACDRAASSLWVEVVAKIVGRSWIVVRIPVHPEAVFVEWD